MRESVYEWERVWKMLYVTVYINVCDFFFLYFVCTATMTASLLPFLSSYSLFLYSSPPYSLMSILMLPYSA